MTNHLTRRLKIRTAITAAALLLMLPGCREAACTLKGGTSGIWVDTSKLAMVDARLVQVCLDTQCIPLGGERDGRPIGHHVANFHIDEIERDYLLVVRSIDGEVLAGPTPVTPRAVYPNGKHCAPKNMVGRFTVDTDGNVAEFELP